MLKTKIKTTLDEAVDELIQLLIKDKKIVKQKLLKIAQNPKYRLDMTKETLELSLLIDLKKTVK